jgi:hypothetical protein
MFLTSCGAAMFLWPSGLAAQAPAGPLPSHDPADAPLASPTPSRDASKSKLAGTWKLNQDQSDDPHQKMQQAAGNSAGPGGNRGGYGGGGRGGYGSGGYGGGRQQGQGMMAEYSQLAIDQTDTTVKVTGSSGHVLAQYAAPDQANSKSNNNKDASAAPSAQWNGSQLTVVSQSEHGGKSTRTYQLSPDGQQLYLTTRIENPRFNQPVTFRFVYDPVKSGSGGNQ